MGVRLSGIGANVSKMIQARKKNKRKKKMQARFAALERTPF
jgi:hypothetical protein